jgi:hypothetical protein
MNYFIAIYLLTTFLCSAFTAPEDAKKAQEFYNGIENEIAEEARKADRKAVVALSRLLMNLGHKVDYHPDPRWAKCYKLNTEAMLQIPGHAKIVANEYEEFRKTETGGDGGARRFWMVTETLIHLPSAETIQVLGEYLDDFKDTDTPNLPVHEQVIVTRICPSPDGVLASDLPWLATYALSKIGLRKPPLENVQIFSTAHGLEPTQHWKTTRAWYQEVKAGKRTFSFRGQPEEYRFNADGTWETIALQNPPDDAITYSRPSSAKTPDTAALLPTKNNAADKDTPWWRWLMATLLVISAAITWRIAAKRGNQSSP